jgi:hypothetical protein
VDKAAARQGGTAIGYWLEEFSHDTEKGFGIHVNYNQKRDHQTRYTG